MKCVIDIEANALFNPDKIWVIVCKDISDNKYYIFRNILDDPEEYQRFVSFSKGVSLWIGHNYLGYDGVVLSSHIPSVPYLQADNVLDTLIISKLVDYPRQSHSIESYGEEFYLPKGDFSDWTKYSVDMENYCIRDVDICHRIYTKYSSYISKPEHAKSIRLEHSFQLVCNELHANGFAFNTKKAQQLLTKVQGELDVLDKDILEEFRPRLKLIREVTPRATKYGTISLSSIPKLLRDNLHELSVDAPFSYCKWVSFNPSSHSQIIKVLNEAKWKPLDKTKTHIDTERLVNQLKHRRRDKELDKQLKECQIKLEILKKTGWKVSEQNLSTLPETAHYILWDKSCQIKIQPKELYILESIINETVKRNEKPRSNTIIKISDIINPNNSKEITEYLSKILKECVKNRADVVKFVESEKTSWSIIATPTDTYVDCSASFATDIWAGMKDLPVTQQHISKIRAASFLAKRILLESRRRTLTEWLSLSRADGSSDRIHGKFYGIGAWTHRMNHQNPNTANIPNEFDTAGKKKLYGKELRALWMAPKNRLLVGVDAEGIQLRIFAHYINDPEFTEALVKGKKDDKTDPHSLNQRILGDACRSRAAAKRFIYALLLGAGLGKLTEILGCDQQETERALDRLLQRYTGWQLLKEEVFPKDAKRGYFIGLDGRKVRIPGDTESNRRHLAMSGYLQNGEAVVMKSATLKWVNQLPAYDARLVNFVHDEWQTECPNDVSIALKIAKMKADSLREVGEDLGLLCPLAGSYWNDDTKDYTIDTNWSKTH